jgi:adenylate cyclase
MQNLEIERKFLVDANRWALIEKPVGETYIQGYLSIDEDKVVRVRIAGGRGFLTIKGRSDTLAHPEYEYGIPFSDATALISAYTKNTVIKRRYRIPAGNHIWEVDIFEGENQGLMVAEIELSDPGEMFEKPDWIGEEVTSDERYYNACLSWHPYSVWKK